MDNFVVKRTYAFSLPAYFSRESTLSAVHAFPAGAALWSNRNTSAHMGTGTLVRAAPHKLPFPEHLGSGILCRNAGRAPALNTIERSSYHTEQVACLSPCASPHLAKPIQASFQGACFDLSIRSESLATANSQARCSSDPRCRTWGQARLCGLRRTSCHSQSTWGLASCIATRAELLL